MSEVAVDTQAEAVAVKEPVKQTKKQAAWDWVKFLIGLAALYLIVMYCTGLTKVSGNSMNSTLSNGQILLEDKLTPHFRNPKYGDVAIIESSALGYDIVKRVIGVEGDTVAISDGAVYVNNEQIVEVYTMGASDDMEEITVDHGEVFVLGDNRTPGESLDSRSDYLGLVKTKEIKAYILLKLIPFGKIAKPLDL